MALLDLKSLTKEEIHDRGLNHHDLWMVKLHEEIFGPYEADALKAHSHQHESLYDDALSSRMDMIDWYPFYEHAQFPRLTPFKITTKNKGPFWILDQGQISHPLSFRDIEKKIEMGVLSFIDHISVDDGRTWNKVCELPDFAHKAHDASQLPQAPVESSFKKAALGLVIKDRKIPDVASLAHMGQINSKLGIKLEELTIQNLQVTEVSGSLKWAIPTAIALIITLAAGGHYLMNPHETGELASETEVNSEARPIAKAELIQPPNHAVRRPSSVAQMPIQTAPAFTHESRFPTHIETHENDSYHTEPERDPADEPVTEVQEPLAQEHSLVGNQEDQSLDAAMNGVDQPAPEQAAIEEVSDF